MREVTHEELRYMIKVCYSGKVPLYIWGAPGIGKSDIVRHVSDELGIQLIDVRISQLDPSDLRGLPTTSENETKWLPPSWLPKEGKGILFFDEMNLAPPSIQAAAYQLILDRKLGDYILPDDWLIIAAGNRLEDKANVFDMSAPLANRFAHAQLSIPSIDVWTEWAIENTVDMRIISFLNSRPSLLFSFMPNNKSMAFPTPRSWFMCSRLIKGKDADIGMLASSTVGDGASAEFETYTKMSLTINIDELIEHPEEIQKLNEISMKYAAVSGVVEKYRNKKSLLEKVINVSTFMEPEFRVLSLRMIKSVDKKYFLNNAKNSKALRRISSEDIKFLM